MMLSATKLLLDIGAQIGHLTLLERIKANVAGRHAMWRCKCECGNITVVRADNLRHGVTKSCGCLRVAARQLRTSGHADQVSKEPLVIINTYECPRVKMDGKQYYRHGYAIATGPALRDWIGAPYMVTTCIARPVIREQHKVVHKSMMRVLAEHKLVRPQGERTFAKWLRDERVSITDHNLMAQYATEHYNETVRKQEEEYGQV